MIATGMIIFLVLMGIDRLIDALCHCADIDQHHEDEAKSFEKED